jgi:hypothetical protein
VPSFSPSLEDIILILTFEFFFKLDHYDLKVKFLRFFADKIFLEQGATPQKRTLAIFVHRHCMGTGTEEGLSKIIMTAF